MAMEPGVRFGGTMSAEPFDYLGRRVPETGVPGPAVRWANADAAIRDLEVVVVVKHLEDLTTGLVGAGPGLPDNPSLAEPGQPTLGHFLLRAPGRIDFLRDRVTACLGRLRDGLL